MRRADLLIVGGGPAGAAAALRAKQLRPEWQVVVLDKDEFPRDKVCGDGIGPHAVAELASLGAHRAVEGRQAVLSIHLEGPNGATATGVPPRAGYVVRRRDFDAAIVAAAVDAGAHVVKERVDSVEATSDGILVNGTWAAPWLVAADGANSRCRRLLGEKGAKGRHLVFAVRGYQPWEQQTFEIRWEKTLYPAYSWRFPLGDGYANVGFGCIKSALDDQGGRTQLWEAAAATCGIDTDEVPLRAHHLPLTSARLSRTHGRVLFAGDAAGLINPLTGEGIYYALASGRIAANAAASGGDVPHEYERGLRHAFGKHFATTSGVAVLANLQRNIDASIRAAARDQLVFDDLVEVAIGDGLLTRRIVTGVARRWASPFRG